jgi:flavin reductase (DIM6/NTAB) family NADH-FMN oxidoreductase RutF
MSIPDGFTHFDVATLKHADTSKLLASIIMPRPIAWIVSSDSNGILNAAPFSFFNIVSTDPPLVAISISAAKDRDMKDTLTNIRARGEFVVNMVPEELAEAMNITAADAPPDFDETKVAGLALVPSSVVGMPRIEASPVALECKLFDIIEPGGSSTICLGRVVYIHIRTSAFEDVERLYIDPHQLRLIGRMHGSGGYTTTRDIFFLPRKTWPLGV